MPNVEIIHWNPWKWHSPARFPYFAVLKRVNNFGDLLGPQLVRRILESERLASTRARGKIRILTVGSIMRLAKTGDTIWGTGVNGKSLNATYDFSHLDVRAVRGPLTRAFLSARGIEAPEVFGDPGLLTSRYWPSLQLSHRSGELVVPNLNDLDDYRGQGIPVLDPRTELQTCIERIASSSFVTGSSLHAIVIAESFGIPARLVRSSEEPSFKYEDYYLGSGRSGFQPARSVQQALELGGEPIPSWDPTALMQAFPRDLWAEVD